MRHEATYGILIGIGLRDDSPPIVTIIVTNMTTTGFEWLWEMANRVYEQRMAHSMSRKETHEEVAEDASATQPDSETLQEQVASLQMQVNKLRDLHNDAVQSIQKIVNKMKATGWEI